MVKTHAEAVAQSCVVEKIFLKISQNSQENTCARVSFLRPQACNFILKKTLAQMFSCEFCEIFKNIFFIEHFRWLFLHMDNYWRTDGSRLNIKP